MLLNSLQLRLIDVHCERNTFKHFFFGIEGSTKVKYQVGAGNCVKKFTTQYIHITITVIMIIYLISRKEIVPGKYKTPPISTNFNIKRDIQECNKNVETKILRSTVLFLTSFDNVI